MKYVVFILLAAIVISLGTGLYYLSRDASGSSRVLRSLEIRVGLSVLLIMFLLVSYCMGWIRPG